MKSNYLAHKLLDLVYGATAFTAPVTVYAALLIAPNWQASTAISLNAFVWSGARIFKCTTAGTTGSSAPSWTTTAGATVSDGSVVWTEQTNAINGGLPSGLEASGGSYARVAITSNTTNFPNASSRSKTTGTAINYTAFTGTIGQVVGVAFLDASSAGNLLDWGYVTTPKDFVSGDTASIGAGSVTLTDS